MVKKLLSQVEPMIGIRRAHPGIFYFLFVGPTVTVILIVALVAAFLVNKALQKSFDPLYFKGAHVAQTPVHVGQDVSVQSTRCNKDSKTVSYSANKAWQSVNPAGTVIFVGLSQSMQPPGCTSSTSVNPMPAGVVSKSTGWLNEKNADGSPKYPNGVQWEIKATNKALDHARSVETTWYTTPITVTK